MEPTLTDLPVELVPFRDRIKATVKPYIKIKAKAESGQKLWQSNFGGRPYLPKDVPYPKDARGQELYLLAQINFAEVPQLDLFPEKGILQFYISGHDDLYGLDFDDMTRQDKFRVLYFPEVIQDENHLVIDFDFLPQFDDVPMSNACSLSFEQHDEPISVGDYQFESRILAEDKPEDESKLYEIYSKYEALLRSEGHKLGGYPYFTQEDPRKHERYRDKGYMLLLQIDSDHEAGIMWGDVGVGNFFILEEDLRQKDFSRVLYNWDCA